MKSEQPRKAISPLAEIEMETLEEGRKWMQDRMKAKLQHLADRQRPISPPEPTATAEGEEN